MENATKALLIAGTVLIAIIMVSIAVFLYSRYKSQAESYSETVSAIELEKFNSKFDVYIGRENITAQEIVSAVNLAKEYNWQVKIYLDNSEISFGTAESFLKDKQDKTFSCKLNTSSLNPNPAYDNEGKIVKLKFTTN